MSPLKVGLLGCGRIAQAIHLKTLAGLPEVHVAALAEADPARREAASRLAPNAALHADYRDLLKARQAEAVVICLPTFLHAEAAEAAFAAGQHVYLEKPLAASLAEGRRILEAWRRSGRAGMIGFNYRFHPLLRALRRDLQAGRIGRAAGAQSAFTTARLERADWRGARGSGGGVLLDLASHHIDLARWLFGEEIAAVQADLRSLESEDDCAALALRLAGGLTVQTLAAFGAVEEDSFAVFGERGKLVVNRYRSLEVEFTAPRARFARLRRLAQAAALPRTLPYWWRKARAPGNDPSFYAALAHFVSTVAAGQAPRPDLLDGYRGLAVVLAAEQAARAGQSVAPEGLAGHA